MRGGVLIASLAVLLAAEAQDALACGVCFGETDAPIAIAARHSVLFMLGLTYAVIGGGLAGFFLARGRSRRSEMRRSASE